MNLEISCVLHVTDPSIEDVSDVVAKLVGFLKDQGVQEQTFLDEFQLAAAEALNNAIEHGCADAEKQFIHTALRIKEHEVELQIGDPSSFGGWTGEATLPEDPLAEGGRGRFLIEQMTSSTEHRLDNGHHVLVLHKAFDGSAWTYEPGSQEQILSSMTEELGSSYEMINALIGLGELLASADDMSAFMELALDRLRELTGAKAAYARLDRGNGLQLAGLSGVLQSAPLPLVSASQAGVESQVFTSGEEVTVTKRHSFAPGDPLEGRAETAFVAPVFFKHKRRGVLVLAQEAAHSFFSAAELKVTRVVAEYLGIITAMNDLQQRRESEQRALRELEIASEIQLSLMPHGFERVPRLDIAGSCLPAMKAGGDYFDIIPLPDGALFVAVADVMGKGISAALLANMLRTNLRAKLDLAPDPGLLAEAVNRTMVPDLSKLDMFITVACAWISPDRSIIREVNAGHPAGLVFREGRLHSSLKSQGMPIGVLPDTAYHTHETPFAVGDCLLLFTDGIPETCDPAGVFFDVEGIERCVQSAALTTSADLVTRILRRVDEFSENAPPGDDRTVVSIIRKS